MAIDLVERRRDQFGKDFSYFLYPIAGDVPGLGSAAGLGVSVLNIKGTDLDFNAFNVSGDFSAEGYTLLNHHFIKNRLILDAGYYNYDVAPIAYNRGIHSLDNDYILPKVQGSALQTQLTLSYWQRQLEYYFRIYNGWERIQEILDKDGRPFDAIDNSKQNDAELTLGFSFDNTDDRLDPRKGIRLEAAVSGRKHKEDWTSDYVVADYNVTKYIPLRKHDSLVFNIFGSQAFITNQARADFATLQQLQGLGCDTLSPGPEQDQCFATERSFIDQTLLDNKYGTATPLGGTQRLRSYEDGRYYAGNSISYGVEYRLNLLEEYTPFNIYFAKGIRTGLQLALFAEQGSVADHAGDLFDTLKTSYGVGFRVILSGVIIRADYASGTDGSEFVLFINYAWSMFSVDG